MNFMETDHDKTLFTNRVTLLLDLILPKRPRTKKVAFGSN